MDPPELNKRRKLISNAFNPRAIAKLEDGIRARAARMIDDLLAKGGKATGSRMSPMRCR